MPVSRDRVADDPGEHLVEVQAGAHRLAHLAQRLELGDLAGQLARCGCSSDRIRSTWRSTIAPCTANSSSRARSRVVEGGDVGAPHRQHADDLVVDDHRGRQQGAVARRAAGGPAGRSPGRRARRRSAGSAGPERPGRRRLDRFIATGWSVMCRRERPPGSPPRPARAGTRRPSAQVELAGVGSAEPGGTLHHGVEDRAGVGAGSAQRHEDLAAGVELLAGVAPTLDGGPHRGSRPRCCAWVPAWPCSVRPSLSVAPADPGAIVVGAIPVR